MKNRREYCTWHNMIGRCYSGAIYYENYPKNGITVCDRWRNSFKNFLEDMGERPAGLTLDRIDNTKGYSPDNCRWADRKTQMRNRSCNRYVVFKGSLIQLCELADLTGLSQQLLRTRIVKYGWDTERAIIPINLVSGKPLKRNI